MSDRPRIAVICTTWYQNSHADVLARRLIEGYEWDGTWVEPRVEVVSAMLDRPGGHPELGKPEIGPDVLAEHGIPVFTTVAEAMGLGRGGVAVDGVVVVGEHGAYGESAFGQILYPRRRFIDSAISVMVATGRTVPVFSDKHLAWDTIDALQLRDTIERLQIPFAAGSSLPLAWRDGDRAWPLGEPMTQSVSIGYGAVDAYGAHLVEFAQTFHERRAGGETGIAEVTSLSGEQAWAAIEQDVPKDLYEAALHVGGPPANLGSLRNEETTLFSVRHHDGLAAWHINHRASQRFSVAARGPGAQIASRALLEAGAPYSHFTFLARHAENLILTGRAAWPLERVVLTSGILDAAMRSLATERTVETPLLDISYAPGPEVPDTGIDRPWPAHVN